MTEFWLELMAAAVAYLIAGWNPAITFSKAIYQRDIRTCGSGNPGFTNFRRTFGNKWAFCVLGLDLAKSAVAVGFFAVLFERYCGCYQLGAAYTGMFAVLGHVYPVWYRFKGGKGFLVGLSAVWVTEPRAGLLATLLMVVLLLLTKYMSLSTVLAMLSCPLLLSVFDASVPTVLFCLAFVVLIALRHRENFRRLRAGTESKFAFRLKKS